MTAVCVLHRDEPHKAGWTSNGTLVPAVHGKVFEVGGGAQGSRRIAHRQEQVGRRNGAGGGSAGVLEVILVPVEHC